MTPVAPDKVEVLSNVDKALAWDLAGPDLPAVDVALDMVEQFTEKGRIVADGLRTLVLSIPVDSDAGISAQATLNEASRRLYLSPPSGTPRTAGHRAQNLARLVQGLYRAVERVTEEQARSARPQAQHVTTKGSR
ncbi:hypothetical protein J7I97_05340 [Streptomyces sp. ISL-87]|nr:hypothetical protein [Streptomyces sp. ISL-21]MBT2607731.1 hypothetical protein [Streptomyces sp. ISL-87]